MGQFEGLMWGFMGGVLAELLGWFKLRGQSAVVQPGVSYWVVTLLMIGAGGLLVVAYMRSNIPLNPLLAINVGAASPLIVGSLIAHAPHIEPGRVD